MINKKEKVVFVHIPKNGGSSMSFMLLEQFEKRRINAGGMMLLPADVKKQYLLDFKEKHQTLYRYYEKRNYDDWYKFCFIRNPWSKMVSEYKWINKNEKTKFSNFVDQYESRFEKMHNPIEPSDYHYISQHQFVFVADVNKMNDCFRFEEYNSVIKHLNETRGWNLKPEHRKKSKKTEIVFDTKLIDKVARIFEKDIEYFGFEYGKPASKNVTMLDEG